MSTVDIAQHLATEDRNHLAKAIVESWQGAITQRKGRLTQIREIDRYFSLRVKPKSFPFAQCANIMTPLLTAPTIQHQSRLFDMVYSGGSRLATVFSPSDFSDPDRELAERYFNHYLLHEMPELPLGLDRTLHQSTLFGSSFRRVIWDETQDRCVSEWIGIFDFVAPHKVIDTDPAMRQLPFYSVMERMSLRRIQSHTTWVDTGELKPAKLDEPDGPTPGDKADRTNDDASVNLDSPRLLIEHYFKWTTPNKPKKDDSLDGNEHPFYAVVDVLQKKLLYLCPREEDDPRDAERFADAERTYAEAIQVQSAAAENHALATDLFAAGHIPEAPPPLELPKLTPPRQRRREVPMCVHYCAYPSEGFYGLGLGDFLLGMTKAMNTVMNQSLDRATMSIARPAFMSNLVKGPRGIQASRPGQIIGLDVPPNQLKDSIYYPETPSGDPFMQYVLGFLQDSAQGIVGSFGTMSGEMPKSNQSAQGTMALIEEMRAPITVMAKRARISLTEEFSQIWRQLGTWLPDSKVMDIIGEDGAVQGVPVGRALFSPNSRIYPVGDSRTKSERMSEASAQFGFAAQNPLVQMALPAGDPNAIKLLQDLSAAVFRAYGNERAAILIAQIGPPAPPPAEMMPPGEAPPGGEGPPPDMPHEMPPGMPPQEGMPS